MYRPGIWTPGVRVGDIGGQLGGSVGGNLLGFVDGCVSDDYLCILGVGYGGSLHLWKQTTSLTTTSVSASSSNTVSIYDEERWSPVPLITGHFGQVNDVVWDNHDSYIISVSSDQTCRIFAQCYISQDIHNETKRMLWHEVSRPLIHGYDINAVVAVTQTALHHSTSTSDLNTNDGTSTSEVSQSVLPSQLIIASDEKVLRVLTPSGCVIEGMQALCNPTPNHNTINSPISATSTSQTNIATNIVYKAYIPELSLSNRAAETMSQSELQELQARNVMSLNWRELPLESQLTDYTVWPEYKKVYGHTNDVICMCMNHQQTLFVTANKAKDKISAKLYVWSLLPRKSYELLYTLEGHESSVVTLQFSPCDQFLISSGKDRSLCLYTMTNNNNNTSNWDESSNSNGRYELSSIHINAHKRIIWDCRCVFCECKTLDCLLTIKTAVTVIGCLLKL